MRSQHREIKDELGRYGIKPNIEKTGSGHVRFRWTANDHAQSLTVASTPSDHRAQKNNVARLRRLLRNAGVELPSEPSKTSSAPDPRLSVLEDRIARLEDDVRMLLERLTAPAPSLQPTPPPADKAAPPPSRTVESKTPNRGGRKLADYSWLWCVLRYDDYLPLPVIVKSTRRKMGYVSVVLTQLKKRGLVQHIRSVGWRKHRSVEQLGQPPSRVNDHAMNGHATH